jgi:hypothetical protein
MNDGTDVAGAARLLSPGGIRSALMDRAGRFLSDRRDVPLAQMAMTPLKRPEQVIPLLNALARSRRSLPVPVAPLWAERSGRAGLLGGNVVTDRRR